MPYEQFSSGESWTYDWKIGAATLTPPLPAEVMQAIAAELALYTQVWQTKFAPINSVGYKVNQISQAKILDTTAVLTGRVDWCPG
jgi:hypothetical protein